ncbi:hypothetical protein PHMEG_00019230 [Phytophthora megakarya]|uniref:Uncharacterized protein n=1 Tax=Phytophthora megakarya TaxID=4795 RepID=A0A225VUN3_9STRA|nr:hypothetical protein PHMEG_00019230 [Phytophthora megakarya]
MSINHEKLSGIVKLQRTEVLSPAERVACADFRLSRVSTSQPTPPSELSIVQQAFKRRKVVKRQESTRVALELGGIPLSFSCQDGK